MAADLTQNFLGKHVEKLVLLAAILVLVVAAGVFVAMRTPQDEVRDDVDRSVKEITARLKEPDLDRALTKEERVSLGVDEPDTALSTFSNRLAGLPENWPALGKMVEPQGQEKPHTQIIEKWVQPPEQVLPVEDVAVVVGRGCTTDSVPVSGSLAKLEGKTPVFDIAWAGCVGKFDLTAQLSLNVAGNAERDPIFISEVGLQRRERKTDGTWSEWKSVPAAGSPVVMAKLPKFPADPQNKASAIAWGREISKMQAEVRRLPFYTLVAVDPEGKAVRDVAGTIAAVEQPDLRPPEAPKAPDAGAAAAPAAAPAAGAEALLPTPAKTAGSIWSQSFPAGPEKPAHGAEGTMEKPAAPHVLATVWANDVTVEPGKTYQYQMRVAIANPVYSHPSVRDEKARWTLQLVGQWSPPTSPVTIPGVVQFYFIGTSRDKASLALHRWIHGQWVIVRSVQSSIGAPVVFSKPGVSLQVPGAAEKRPADVNLSPQVFLVDVIRDFPYQPEGNNRPILTSVLIFSDARGRLSQRIAWEDVKAEVNDRQKRENVIPKGGTPPAGVTPPRTPPAPPPRTPPRPPRIP